MRRLPLQEVAPSFQLSNCLSVHLILVVLGNFNETRMYLKGIYYEKGVLLGLHRVEYCADI